MIKKYFAKILFQIINLVLIKILFLLSMFYTFYLKELIMKFKKKF